MSTACAATAQRAGPARGVPIARRMAKSRWRSSADRNTTAPMITAVTSHSRARTRSTEAMASSSGPSASLGDVVGGAHDRARPARRRARPSSSTPETTSRLWNARSWAVPSSTNTSGRPASTVVPAVRPTTSTRSGPSCTWSPTSKPADSVEHDLVRSADRRALDDRAGAPSSCCSSAGSPPTTTTSVVVVGVRPARSCPRATTTPRASAPSSPTSAGGSVPADVNGPLVPSASTQCSAPIGVAWRRTARGGTG